MLGSIGSAGHWYWAACGKHPAAKDYFWLGPDAPLVKAFSGWMDEGYRMLGSRRNHAGPPHAWRFWAKGSKKDDLVCGLGRDSSDGIGRPYPVLVMGAGPLKGWEDNWDLLPFACEKTWSQMEYLVTRAFADLKQLEDAVRGIRPPDGSWSDFRSRVGSERERASAKDSGEVACGIESLSQGRECIVPLDRDASLDPFTLAGIWHSQLKARAGSVPNAVFLGGVSEGSYLAVFRRPLAPGDFIRLWSVGVSGGEA